MVKRKSGSGKYVRYIAQDPMVLTGDYKYHPFG